ncbi:hypothetical protein TrCOL_g515 [Triparma columacea]|uniref:Uncharacterized protein n=1 Tax=Triparma columacea TaxID=722753 RepID=A0A9W7GMR9_9STRA|nr:hypothetical protein TrCOL_g515 [Triparma columacea]
MSCIEEGLGEEGSKIREDDGKEDLGECNMSILIQVLKRKDDRSLKMKVFMILKNQVDGKAKVMKSTLIGLGFSKCQNIILRAAFKKIFSFKTLEYGLVNEISLYLEEALNDGRGSEVQSSTNMTHEGDGESVISLKMPQRGMVRVSSKTSSVMTSLQQIDRGVPPSVGSVMSESVMTSKDGEEEERVKYLRAGQEETGEGKDNEKRAAKGDEGEGKGGGESMSMTSLLFGIAAICCKSKGGREGVVGRGASKVT